MTDQHEKGAGASPPDPYQGKTRSINISISFLKGHTAGWQERGWFVQLVAIEPKRDKDHKGDIQAVSVAPDEIDSLASWIEAQHGKRWGIYFCVNPLRSRLLKKAKKADIAALAYLHVDNDPRKSELLDTERERLRAEAEAFRVKPSELVNSGNGLGLFWRLAEPILVDGNIDELEVTNERLAQHFQADDCHNLDRIMRLPGTVNIPDYRKVAKGRVPVPAKLLDQNDARYQLTDFAFLSPVAARIKVAKTADSSGVPRFDELLAGDDTLRKRWEGDTDGLKDASPSGLDMSLVSLLVIRGFNDAEVAMVLRCCEHGKRGQGRGDDADIPRMLAKARANRVLSRNKPVQTAYRLLAERYTAEDGTRVLRHWRGDFYRWDGCAYRMLDPDDVKAEVYGYLEGGHCLAAKDKREPFHPKHTHVNEVLTALQAIVHLEHHHDAPCWLDRRDGDPDPGELLAMANGLLHLPSRTLYQHTPRLFTTVALPFAYDPCAELPMAWIGFLRDLWCKDMESIETLQEWFGLMLIADTSQQKIMMLVGPPRAGKGVIARILQALLGLVNCASPTLASFGSNFGLQPLIGKSLAVISDARLSGRIDKKIVTERLLTLSGQDSIDIDRKYKEPWTGTLSVRLMILTNELPAIEDMSGALASRFILLQLTQSWLNREDPGLANRLMLELPGIFNWALRGLDRLRERGYFRQPAAAKEIVQDLHDLGSPIEVFLRDCCVVDPDARVERHVLFLRWRSWCLSNGRESRDTSDLFGKHLHAALPGLKTEQPRENGARKRYYVGVGLLTEEQALPVDKALREVIERMKKGENEA